MVVDGIKIQGVTCDSRKVKPGYIFVAIQGEQQNGNDYISEALDRGAVLVYSEQKKDGLGVPAKQVKNARQTLAQLCNQFYDYPAEKLKVVGVTGTNGKTTTTHLIYHTLKDSGLSVGLIGTLHVKINDETYPATLTTPMPEETFFYLHQMVAAGVQVVVLEVSSHGLKSDRVYPIRFHVAIHTNIEADHLNYHKTFADYLASKKKLFDQLVEGGVALINIDDRNSLGLLENNRHAIVMTYGLNLKSTVTASSIDGDMEIFFNYCLQRGISTLAGREVIPFEYPITLRLLGNHNVYNALAAISCSLLFDLPIEKIAQSIRGFRSLARRMEIIYKEEYTVVDDFCHNPASYEAVLEGVQAMRYGNLHIINSVRGNRGQEINQNNAEVLKQWAAILNVTSLIVTDSQDYTQPKDRVLPQERDCFLEVLERDQIPFQYEATLEKAVQQVKQRVKKDDLVLLLGSQGMDAAKSVWMKQ